MEHTIGDEILAKNLTAVREAQGMTKRDLARASGVDRITIWAAETARRDMKISTVRALADALNVTMGELLD